MSYKPEVVTKADREWVSNGLRFTTQDEATCYAHDLWKRWTAVTGTRVVESPDPANYKWVEGQGAVAI